MSRKTGSRLAAAEKTAAEIRELVPWVTPRQLEYWVERGFVISEEPQVQGHPRAFSDAEKRVLRTMARLTRAGMRARLAARVARSAVEQDEERARTGSALPGPVHVDLDDGIYITIPDV